MILKLIIKNKRNKSNQIIVWIQKNGEFEEDLQQLFDFFKDDLKITERWRFRKYYRVTSEKPAIMMSFFSAAHDLIPEIYFNNDAPEINRSSFI